MDSKHVNPPPTFLFFFLSDFSLSLSLWHFFSSKYLLSTFFRLVAFLLPASQTAERGKLEEMLHVSDHRDPLLTGQATLGQILVLTSVSFSPLPPSRVSHLAQKGRQIRSGQGEVGSRGGALLKQRSVEAEEVNTTWPRKSQSNWEQASPLPITPCLVLVSEGSPSSHLTYTLPAVIPAYFLLVSVNDAIPIIPSWAPPQ